MFRNLLSAFANLLFPSSCLLCRSSLPGRPNILFCGNCLAGMQFIRGPICSRCGRPFTADAQPEHLCSQCLSQPCHFDLARAIVLYDGPVLESIHQFKFRKKTVFAESLGRIGLGELPLNPAAFDLLIPVPLHIRRLRERGFNQALLLLWEWAGSEEARIDFRSLVRTKWTKPQVGLNFRERRRNIKGAFAVTVPSAVGGRKILLCDDVFTTGATANECARVLKEAGAAEVSVLTLARAASQ
ncbi:MAG: ComF family protein [Pseudomonadota bacterium]